MASYTIKVNNQSTAPQQFLLFNAEPELSETVGQAYLNVWVKSPPVPNPNGHAEFDITVDNFAVCGTTQQPLGNGVVVSTGDSIAVTLTGASPGTKGIVEVVDGGPRFELPAQTTDVANSFAIFVEPYNPVQYPDIYCGYGKHDQQGNVVPVVVWQAASNTGYEITPKVTYYIGTGSFQQGETVDVTTIGPVSTIDFTLAPPGATIATIDLTVENEYTAPVFSYPGGN